MGHGLSPITFSSILFVFVFLSSVPSWCLGASASPLNCSDCSPSNSSLESQSGPHDGANYSPATLLFFFPAAILGFLLFLFGRLLPLFSTTFAFAATLAFPTWSATLNLVHHAGPAPRAAGHASQIIAIWAIVSAAAILGAVFRFCIGKHGHTIGLYLLSIQAGFLLGLSILLFGNQLSIHSAALKWLLIAFSTAIYLLLAIFSRTAFSASISSATAGAFLFWLAIDLPATRNRGISLGIRFLVDHNPHHAQELESYKPPTLTRLFLALCWAFMFLGTWFQFLTFDGPFQSPQTSRKRRPDSVITNESVEIISQTADPNSGPETGATIDYYAPNDFEPTMDHDAEKSPAQATTAEFHQVSPPDSEQRYTTGSYDTGLSAIPEVTERSRSESTGGTGRGGSRSGSGSARGATGMLAHSHRHPSNATSNSIRRSTYSSDHHLPCPVPAHTNGGPGDPGCIPVSPPTTVMSEATLFPEDSISQSARRRLGLPIHGRSTYIEEETEVVMSSLGDDASVACARLADQDLLEHETRSMSDYLQVRYHAERRTPPPAFGAPETYAVSESHLGQLSSGTYVSASGSTGILTRIAHAFGDGASLTDQGTRRESDQSERVREDLALESDAERWATLATGQSPYQHTASLRRDLHVWTTDQNYPQQSS